jgi:hypothetical protein
MIALCTLFSSCRLNIFSGSRTSPFLEVRIKEYGVSGIMVPDTVNFFIADWEIEGVSHRFTPTFDDVLHFERQFHLNNKDFEASKPWGKSNPRNGDVYKKMRRHYVGYVLEDGTRMLAVFLYSMKDRYNRKNWGGVPFFSFDAAIRHIFFHLDQGVLLDWADVESNEAKQRRKRLFD